MKHYSRVTKNGERIYIQTLLIVTLENLILIKQYDEYTRNILSSS